MSTTASAWSTASGARVAAHPASDRRLRRLAGGQEGTASEADWHVSILGGLREHIGDRAAAFLRDWWTRPPSRHEPNIEMAGTLVTAGYTVAVLRNAAPGLRERIDENLGRKSAGTTSWCRPR